MGERRWGGAGLRSGRWGGGRASGLVILGGVAGACRIRSASIWHNIKLQVFAGVDISDEFAGACLPMEATRQQYLERLANTEFARLPRPHSHFLAPFTDTGNNSNPSMFAPKPTPTIHSAKSLLHTHNSCTNRRSAQPQKRLDTNHTTPALRFRD